MAPRLRTTPRKRPAQRRSAETVEAILAATAQVLVRHGYEAASTNRIAEVAGVSVGSLYQYFPNKESLVRELIKRHCDEMWALFEGKMAELQGAPVAVAAREMIRLEFAAHAIAPKLHAVFVEQVPRVGALDKIDEVTRKVTELGRLYLEAHRREIAPRDPALAAFVVVRMVESLAHAAVLERPHELAGGALLDETVTAVLRYLGVSSRS